MDDYDYLFKILVLGDSGVGKSCILQRFVDRTYSEHYISTIGVDFKIRTINVDGKQVKLQIWDAAGQERFRSITTSYYRGAQGILLVYDVADAQSFSNCDLWLKEVQRFASEKVSLVLVGNKCDLKTRRVVDQIEAKQYASERDLAFFECSAKADVYIDFVFHELAKILMKQMRQMSDSKKSILTLTPVIPLKSCC